MIDKFGELQGGRMKIGQAGHENYPNRSGLGDWGELHGPRWRAKFRGALPEVEGEKLYFGTRNPYQIIDTPKGRVFANRYSPPDFERGKIIR